MSDDSWLRSRAYVQLLSNRLVLSGEEFDTHFHEIAAGDYPLALVPRFIHEAMHHATFHMPLCTALAFEQSEAERTILSLDAPDSVLLEAANRFLFSHLLQRALSPLFEGMACFAEYDLIPGASNTVSWPSYVLSTLRAIGQWNAAKDGVLILNDNRGTIVKDTQNAARQLASYVQKRAAFLASPYNPLSDTHLFGYVFFKAFWLTAKAETKAFQDPELFVAYFLEYVFADAIAIDLVLGTQSDVEASLDKVLKRVTTRLLEIAGYDQSDAALALDQRGDKSRTRSEIELNLQCRIETRMDSARTLWKEDSVPAAMLRRQARQFAFRDYLSLGATRVMVVCDGVLNVSVKNSTGRSMFSLPVFDGYVPSVESAGWLEVVFSPYRDPALLAAVVSVDGYGTIAASMLLRESSKDELEEAFGTYPGCLESFEKDATGVFEVGMADVLKLIDSDQRQRAVNCWIRWVDETYCKGIDLFRVVPELWQWRRTLGVDNGFASFLDANELRTWAALSSVTPGNENQASLRKVLGDGCDDRLHCLALRLEEELAIPVITGPPWVSWL